jgi:hypothetical protein
MERIMDIAIRQMIERKIIKPLLTDILFLFIMAKNMSSSNQKILMQSWLSCFLLMKNAWNSIVGRQLSLSKTNRHLSNEILGTENDPFNASSIKDIRYQNAIKFIEENWSDD